MATQIHTGNQRRVSVGSATDSEGNPVDVTSLDATSENTGLVGVRPGSSPVEVIVEDVEGAGLGSAIVHFLINGSLDVPELFEIVAGDAAIVTLAVGDEEPRGI